MNTQDKGERMRKLVEHYFVSLHTTVPNPTDELRILSEIAYLEEKILTAFETLEYMIRIPKPLKKEVIEHLLKQGFRYWLPIKGDISITNESYMLLPDGNPNIMFVLNQMRGLVEYTLKQKEEEEEKTDSGGKTKSTRKCMCGSDLHFAPNTTNCCCLCFESKNFRVIDCKGHGGGILIWRNLNEG